VAGPSGADEVHVEKVTQKSPGTKQLGIAGCINTKASRGRRKKTGAGGARAGAGRKPAVESAEAAHSAVINTPVAAPVALKKLKAKQMNFDDARTHSTAPMPSDNRVYAAGY